MDGHAFASTANYASDLALLNYLLQDMRVLMRRAARGEIDLAPQQVLTWEVHGLRRRTVVCNPGGLLDHRDAQIVGFFGDRRADADQASIDASELRLIEELANYSGMLSYSSIELVDEHWANLVVHRQPEDREAWRGCPAHRRAVDAVAPGAYHSVRIHNGCVRGGVTGSGTVLIESTKYWDYDTSPVWHAVRRLPPTDADSAPAVAAEA